MKISELMSKKVIWVNMDDRLLVVKTLFEENSFHHLMVVNNQHQLVAVISDRDYAKAIHPNVDKPSATTKELATLNKRVHQIVTKKLVCIDEHSTLRNAITLFYLNKITCLPVVNDAKKPVGVISWRDLLKWLYEKISEKD